MREKYIKTKINQKQTYKPSKLPAYAKLKFKNRTTLSYDLKLIVKNCS